MYDYVVSTFFHSKLVPIYTCLLPSAPKWYWTCFLARIPFTPNWCHLYMLAFIRPKVILNAWHTFPSPPTGTQRLCSHYFPPPQTGAHLYMPAPHPKLILNVLPGTHSLHPQLVHNAYVVNIFLDSKLVPIYTCLLPSTPTWYWTCFVARIPFTPNWYNLYSEYFPPPQTGAHLYMLASIRPKVILNVLPGTHSLHPKLVLSSTPNWCPFIHACRPHETDTERASWHAFPLPQTGSRSLCSQYFAPP